MRAAASHAPNNCLRRAARHGRYDVPVRRSATYTALWREARASRPLRIGASMWLGLVASCGIGGRVVEERRGDQPPGVLGASSGTGGGGASSSGASGGKNVSGSSGGLPTKDVNPGADANFPPFGPGQVCDVGTASAVPTFQGCDGGAGGGQASAGGAGGAECLAARSPSILAKLQGDLGHFAVDHDFFVWTTNGEAQGTLVAASLGALKPITLKVAPEWIQAIAVDSTSVYFAYSDLIEAVPRTGGAVRVIASKQYARSLALDTRELYWASAGKIRRTSPQGGPGQQLVELDSVAFRIALDDTNVYSLGKFSLTSTPKCDVKSTVISEASGFGGGLALDAGFVYWSDDDGIKRAPKSADAPPTLLAHGGSEFAVDDTFVYWGTPGAVMRRPLVGGELEVFAEANAPSVQGVNDTHLFWVDGGILMMASK